MGTAKYCPKSFKNEIEALAGNGEILKPLGSGMFQRRFKDDRSQT